MVAAVAVALVIVRLLGVSVFPGLALVTNPAQPLNPRLIKLKVIAASSLTNLFLVSATGRIVVTMIRNPPLSVAGTQVASTRSPTHR